MTAAPPNERHVRRPNRPMVLLRPVPGKSAVHDLWAGTKLLVVCGISVLLTFYPGWIAIEESLSRGRMEDFEEPLCRFPI